MAEQTEPSGAMHGHCGQIELTEGGPLAAPLNILVIYHSRQTFTNTVFEHLNAFARFSAHRCFFCHHEGIGDHGVDLARFDAVVIHYCLRMPMDQISDELAEALNAFSGLKVLFLQDEYEHTQRAWHWIQRLGIHLVFTVVPTPGIATVYPPAQFPFTRFVNNLTGYVPEALGDLREVAPPSTRNTVVGYRGRHLPLVYGALGREKVGVGRLVREYCERRGIAHDIAWTEDARIYGAGWYAFVGSCRAMLGSESGSNVFDWDGTLPDRVKAYHGAHPQADDDTIYGALIAPLEMPGLMNQVSPRIFEAIALRTVLVLFEGSYSGVVQPWVHYIPLCKDGSNLDEVFSRLADDAFVDAMAERAWRDVIGSGRYSYFAFMRTVDSEIARLAASTTGATPTRAWGSPVASADPGIVTTFPVRWSLNPPPPAVATEIPVAVTLAVSVGMDEPLSRWNRLRQAASLVWSCLPAGVRTVLRPVVRGLFRPAATALHRLHAARLKRKQARI